MEVRADFPADPSSAGQARRFVDATLRAWSCDALLDVATLLVSELVSNAVLHAGTSIRVVVRSDGERIRVEVHDGAHLQAARKHYSALATTGRGLLLVERMSDSWGVTSAEDGKSVWFELNRAEEPSGPDVDALAFDLFDLDDELDDPGDAARFGPGGDRRVVEGEEWRDPRALVRLVRA